MVIIDTSVIFKWFSQEDYREKAIEILSKHLKKTDNICIPDLIFYELTNAWATKTDLSVEEIKENLLYIKTYKLSIAQIDFTHFTKAAEYAKQYHVSVYDSIYAVLAEEKKCILFTADSKFIQQVNLPFIKHIKDY